VGQNWWEKRVNFQREFSLKQRYGGAQPNISQTIIKNTLVPKPNIKEQNAIADSMTLFDSKICHHKSKKDSLTALFKTLLHELMTGQRRVHELEFEDKKITNQTL